MAWRSNLVVTALAILSLPGCVQLNANGSRPTRDAAAEAAPPDATGPGPDTPSGASPDAAAPGDATADVMPFECTPRTVGCTIDYRTTRACDDQGQWVVGTSCASGTMCSGGLCLCSPGSCDEGAIGQTQTAGPVEDLAAGGRFLFLAVNGPLASVRRFDLEAQPATETVVRMGARDLTFFALDSDPMGNLISCSDVRTGATPTGQLMYGEQPLDAGPCTHVRRQSDLVYYLGDVLYRRALDASTPPETVTREAMETFELAGDSLYFAGTLNQDAFLKRSSLADPSIVDTLLLIPNAKFLRVMPDATRVYLISNGDILRVPGVGTSAQPEVFWHEAGPIAWAMAQTDSHVYWTTTTPSETAGCSEAQVFRRPKAGGPVTVLSKVAGYCAGQLIRVGERLYAAVWGGLPSTVPTKILRIRL